MLVLQRICLRRTALDGMTGCLVFAAMLGLRADDTPKEEAIPQPVSAAIIPFHDKTAKQAAVKVPREFRDDEDEKEKKADLGSKVTDMLFAELVAKPEMFLVDREDLKKTLTEHELNLSGAVDPNQAIQVGQLTGARILITGSVLIVGDSQYLVAKIIGTETSRVLGASVKGKTGDNLGPMVEKLANEVAKVISTKSEQIVAKPAKKEDRMSSLNKKLGDKKRPSLVVMVKERHVSRIVFDPAAQTEIELMAKETGFELVQKEDNEKPNAEIMIVGEGISEFGGRVEGIVSVKARLEVKAIERRTGKILAVDRQTTVALDRTEQIAGKTALQEAAAKIAERMLPKLVTE